ncbi:ATP-binding cassette domain-containing protein [Sneathiella chungangensis]|uniref:ATP-binding cassette domain-containing protein n=1 Tax=Sneathiella chungangensis TaxID=1418234 RepID=A0A845MDQ2_9PROT|nr:ATP-binding cassette domain-containing protein [Sneathiella chungangensis]
MEFGASVTFDSVSKTYGAVKALSDFNLSIQRGEFVTLLGPSGSGKTTALNVLAGFADATEGDVRVNKKSILGLPPERRNIGMVFQNYSLFPHMNVFENVAFPLRLRKMSQAEIKKRVGDSLAMVQLAEFGDRMPNQLSGGQRQRVAFARAIVFEPSVLLMDEPLGALDLKLREAMQLEIKRYHKQLGCTILFVTHDQGEALALSDRIAVMGEGQIVQIDTPDRIYDEPNSKYVADFIGTTNIVDFERVSPSRVRFSDLDVEFELADSNKNWGEGRQSISLRPEKLHRDISPSDQMIIFDGSIEEYLFLGNIIQYSVKTKSGKTLLFQEHRGPSVPILARGETLKLAFSINDARPLDEGTHGSGLA